MTPNNRKILYFGTALIVLTAATSAHALPPYAVNTANSCSVCHATLIAAQPAVEGGGDIDGRGVSGIMEVTLQGLKVDLGTQLTGQTRGPLTTFQAAPGETVTLQITVPGSLNEHAVQLKRLEKEGQLNDVTNRLVWNEANAAGNIWARQEVTNPPYFTKGPMTNTGTVVHSFDLMIDKATPPDVYDLEYAVAGHDSTGLFYEDEHFYLQVTGAGPSKLINLSTRGLVDIGEEIMIAGFVIEGTEPKTVLIRAAGPGLVQFGISGTLADPVLTLYNQADTSTPIGSNDDWGDAANLAEIEAASAAVFAFGWTAGSADAAMLVTLDPGAYTAQVSGGAGVAIVEVYCVD